MNFLQKIQQCFEKSSVFYTRHSLIEMRMDEFGKINDEEVAQTIKNGEIIEEYPNDKPYPSVLVFGLTDQKRPLHIVCAYDKDEDITIIITAYQPDSKFWIEFKRRIK